jgi:hypothetical protein
MGSEPIFDAAFIALRLQIATSIQLQQSVIANGYFMGVLTASFPPMQICNQGIIRISFLSVTLHTESVPLLTTSFIDMHKKFSPALPGALLLLMVAASFTSPAQSPQQTPALTV